MFFVSRRVVTTPPVYRCVHHRQFDDECGPFARFAVRRDGAAVFLDDAVTQAQTEPGAFTHLLGREKWIENFGKMFGGNSRPVVLEW